MVVNAQEGMSDLAAVRLAYESGSDREIKGTTDEIGYDQWEIRTPVFFKEAGDWKFAAGVRYQSVDLDFTDSTVLDEDRLHSLDLAFFLSKKSSDTLDWLFLFNPTLAGDYENTDKDAFNYLTIAGAKWKQSDNLQWIFGAVYTTGIGDDLFVPAIGLIWEPSDRSSLVFAGPIIRYSYQLSDSLALNLGGQFVGNRWNTEATYGGSLEERKCVFADTVFQQTCNGASTITTQFSPVVVMILPENLKLNHPLSTRIEMWKMAVFLKLVINTNSSH